MTTPLSIEVDAQALQAEIDHLASISEHPAPAVTRILFSEADQRGREYVKGLCAAAGLELRHDPVGNIFARWRGSDDSLKPVGSGSHIDAIPNAGRYDGVVGVLGFIEAVRALQRAGFKPRHSLELIIFTAEEPTRFGLGCLGSRMLAGSLSPGQVGALRDKEGKSLEELRQGAGISGDLETVRLLSGAYEAFVELHIEQGPLLEAEGLPIGIVEKIAGPSTLHAEITGTGGHAGAVLMPLRHDALLAAAELALAVEKAALESGCPDTVATTGVFRIEPGAVNSIPCAARLEIDLRDTNLAARGRAQEHIEMAAAGIAQARGVQIKTTLFNADPPAIADGKLVDAVEQVCQDLKIPAKRMISRAYHDSLFMAQICPTTMIFIPCYKGYSHRPDEYSSPEQIKTGVKVLAAVLAKLAG